MATAVDNIASTSRTRTGWHDGTAVGRHRLNRFYLKELLSSYLPSRFLALEVAARRSLRLASGSLRDGHPSKTKLALDSITCVSTSLYRELYNRSAMSRPSPKTQKSAAVSL